MPRKSNPRKKTQARKAAQPSKQPRQRPIPPSSSPMLGLASAMLSAQLISRRRGLF